MSIECSTPFSSPMRSLSFSDVSFWDSGRTQEIATNKPSHVTLTSRPTALLGGSLAADACRVADSDDQDDFPAIIKVNRSLTGYFRGDQQVYSTTLRKSTKNPTGSGQLNNAATSKLKRLAESFKNLHIDTNPRPVARISYCVDTLNRVCYGTSGSGTNKSQSYTESQSYNEIGRENDSLNRRLQSIYTKPPQKIKEPIKIRSRWELAESERLRLVKRENQIVSLKIKQAKSSLLGLPSTR